jgi:hypothetical protein
MAVPPRLIMTTRLRRARRDETTCVRCARMRGTKRGWRRFLLVTGATMAMMTGGGGRWRMARGRTRARGRGEMGPGGPYAHQEHVGVDGDAGGGRTATPWSTTCCRLAEKWSRFRRLEASQQARVGEEAQDVEAELRRCLVGLGAVSSDRLDGGRS